MGNYTNTVFPWTSVWGWTRPSYVQKLTCARPAGLISIFLTPCLWEQFQPWKQPACSLEAWKRCLEALPGGSCSRESQPKRLFAKCWTGARKDGSKVQSHPSSFPWSYLMPSQVYYFWLQSSASRPSWVTPCNGSQDFRESSLLRHSRTQTASCCAAMASLDILRVDKSTEEAFRCYAGTQPLKTQLSAGANTPPLPSICQLHMLDRTQ